MATSLNIMNVHPLPMLGIEGSAAHPGSIAA
jgi:hypothetical protein